MGCDIHLVVEIRTEAGWVQHPSPFPKYDMPGFSWEDDPEARHYALFTLLAGVRGVPVFEPLFPYRGLPEDIAPLEDDWLGDHSHTWASFRELKEVNWGELAECSFRRWVDGRLTEIANEAGTANVRVLMGFDS